MNRSVSLLDSTLRDGAQARGISFSVPDKLKIAKTLDDLGVGYIEAGNPGSNPKDLEFFKLVRETPLKHAKIAAFGSTRRRGADVESDKNVLSVLAADAPVVCIVGKSWDFHARAVLGAGLDENLRMIEETVAFFKRKGKEVIFDAEHFFDGYKSDPAYAMKTLDAAALAGADILCLCDTNGGAFPADIEAVTAAAFNVYGKNIGVHCHDDCGMAVANTVVAIGAGASHAQGTINGFGERCGNACLSTVIPNLQLKQHIQCIPDANMAALTTVARLVAEIANDHVSGRAPYVGGSAFAHKGGMHADGVAKAAGSYEHIDPERVGNKREILTSEVAGKAAVLLKIGEMGLSAPGGAFKAERITEKLKELEHQGYQYEAAEGSFSLVVRKQLGRHRPFFELKSYRVLGEQPYEDGKSASALIKVVVDGKTEITAAEGDGPVNALDKALRKALGVFYPSLSEVYLTDYKVRVLDGKSATASKVRVLIESTDGADIWTTVGVSRDIIEASWFALLDSIEYKLFKDNGRPENDAAAPAGKR